MVGNINSLLIALSWARLMLSNVIWSSNNLENLKMSSLLGCCPLLRICHPNIKQIYVNEARETRGLVHTCSCSCDPFHVKIRMKILIIVHHCSEKLVSKLNNLTLNCFSLFFSSHSRLKMYLIQNREIPLWPLLLGVKGLMNL